MDLERAYKILGLTPGAGREKIEENYGILVKRQQGFQLELPFELTGEASPEEMNEAYNLLVEYERDKVRNAQAAAENLKPCTRFWGKSASVQVKSQTSFIIIQPPS